MEGPAAGVEYPSSLSLIRSLHKEFTVPRNAIECWRDVGSASTTRNMATALVLVRSKQKEYLYSVALGDGSRHRSAEGRRNYE